MTLNKQKYRYIGIFVTENYFLNNGSFYEKFSERYVGLFGYFDFYNSKIRIINLNKNNKNVIIIKCKLESLVNILVAISYVDSGVCVFATSGTLKRLRKKMHQFTNYIINNNLINS